MDPTKEPSISFQAAFSDEVYRGLVAADFMPKIVICAKCGGMATFRDDLLAARYECLTCGHAMAAMWARAVKRSSMKPSERLFRLVTGPGEDVYKASDLLDIAHAMADKEACIEALKEKDGLHDAPPFYNNVEAFAWAAGWNAAVAALAAK